MNDNNSKTLIWDNIPEWAIYSLEYGVEEDCIIRWQDTLDTLETRIALSMDPDTEWDEEIFYYCNSRNELKSLTEKGCSDFVIADCFGFGMYEKPMQEI